MPAQVFGLIFVGPLWRIIRFSVLAVMPRDHLRSTRSKGLRRLVLPEV